MITNPLAYLEMSVGTGPTIDSAVGGTRTPEGTLATPVYFDIGFLTVTC